MIREKFFLVAPRQVLHAVCSQFLDTNLRRDVLRPLLISDRRVSARPLERNGSLWRRGARDVRMWAFVREGVVHPLGKKVAVKRYLSAMAPRHVFQLARQIDREVSRSI